MALSARRFISLIYFGSRTDASPGLVIRDGEKRVDLRFLILGRFPGVESGTHKLATLVLDRRAGCIRRRSLIASGLAKIMREDFADAQPGIPFQTPFNRCRTRKSLTHSIGALSLVPTGNQEDVASFRSS